MESRNCHKAVVILLVLREARSILGLGQDHNMMCLNVQYFTDTTNDPLPAASLIQKWVWISMKSGCGPKFNDVLWE